MDQPVGDTFLSNLTTPKELLRILRILFLPMVVMTSLAYPWALFSAIMATDSGTPAAMRAGYLIFFGCTFYLVAVIFVAIKWDDWALLSAILLTPVCVTNLAGVIFLPKVVSLIPWIALGFLGLSVSDTAVTIIGLILFILLFVVVPLLSIWRLVRHSFELDVVDYSRPVDLWDLKRLNK